MASLTIADLTTPLTREQSQAKVYEVLALLGVSTTSWKAGSVVRTMIVATSVVFAAFTQLMAEIAKSGFLQYASQDWLTIVALQVYGVTRIEATYATGVLTWGNGSGASYVYDPGDIIVANTVTGATYTNTETVTLPPATSGLSFAVRATVAGSASSADPGDISGSGSLVTPITGVTVNNAGPLTGFDQQTDESLRAACSQKLGSLSPFGPWDAYTYALHNAVRLDGTTIGITRLRLVADGFGHVDCYVATPDGGVSGDMSDPTTDLGAAMVAVQENAAPQAITARVHSATAVPMNIDYTAFLYNTSGQTEAQIIQTILDALEAWASKQPVAGNIVPPNNGLIYVDAIRGVIGDAMPEVFHVEIADPSADLILAFDEIMTIGTVTATITQVPPPEGYHP